MFPHKMIKVGVAPYLKRIYLIRKFAEDGLSKFAAFLHVYYREDWARALHTHPWEWSLSIVLRGEYIEERGFLFGRSGIHSRLRRVRWFNFLTRYSTHRIIAVKPGTITLFIHGRKRSEWGFIVNGIECGSMTFVPHAEYVKAHEGEKPKEGEAPADYSQFLKLFKGNKK